MTTQEKQILYLAVTNRLASMKEFMGELGELYPNLAFDGCPVCGYGKDVEGFLYTHEISILIDKLLTLIKPPE